MRRLLNLIILARPHNVAAAVLSVAVGYGIAMRGTAPWILLAGVATATAGGYVINDISDRDIDAINKPWRPIPSGALTPAAAWALYAVFVIVTALAVIRLPLIQALWIACWVLLLYLYSARLKREFLAGNVLVSLVSGSGFLLGAVTAGRASAGAIPALFTFFFSLGREIVKDTDDIEGDRACGARTIPVVSGEERALRFAALLFVMLALSFPLPWITGLYGSLYALVMICTVVPILLVSAWLSWRGRSLGRVSGLLKLGMFCGILAFYLGPWSMGW
jgi:geranylgeranylglycerol-phosphate geranylgeranyltransferase